MPAARLSMRTWMPMPVTSAPAERCKGASQTPAEYMQGSLELSTQANREIESCCVLPLAAGLLLEFAAAGKTLKDARGKLSGWGSDNHYVHPMLLKCVFETGIAGA
jgi:hypothetical protein